MTAPVALVGCNNFNASCERVFQPGLRGLPLVVLSNNDGRVIARSNEDKALGIAMGEPWHMVRERLGADVILMRSSNYTRYGDMSARVMRILADFTPELELYSTTKLFSAWAASKGGLKRMCARFEATCCKARPASRLRKRRPIARRSSRRVLSAAW